MNDNIGQTIVNYERSSDHRSTTQAYSYYVSVDSAKRQIENVIVYGEELFSLPPFSIEFNHGSSIVKVHLPGHQFKTNDMISLSNVVSKNINLRNVLMVKKDSEYMKICHHAHGMSQYGLFDPTDISQFIPVKLVDDLPSSFSEDKIVPDHQQYYVLKNGEKLDFTLQFSNIKGNNFDRNFIGNIPINYLNKTHCVYLLYTFTNGHFIVDQNSYVIKLSKKSSINYKDGVNIVKNYTGFDTNLSTNDTVIKFNNLMGIPLRYLNHGISENNALQYVTIKSRTANTFIIDIGYKAIVDPHIRFYSNDDTTLTDPKSKNLGGSSQMFIRKIKEIINGYPNSNQYKIKFDKVYKNVMQVKLISTIFPANDNNISIVNGQTNNKLYWRNLNDGDHIYDISLCPGYYSLEQLVVATREEFQKTPRINKRDGYNNNHIIDIDISKSNQNITFSSYQEITQQNTPGLNNVVFIPDESIEITMAEDLRTASNHPFDPTSEALFVYFTPNCHKRIKNSYIYAYNQLYKYVDHLSPEKTGYNTFLIELETETAILVNFFRNKDVFPNNISKQEINSINTSTILDNFKFNHLTNEVFKPNHGLKKGDLIITDQFTVSGIGQIFVYQIIDTSFDGKFSVKQIRQGRQFKFIYDGLLINFGKDDRMIDWLDQIDSFDDISFDENMGANNTFSIVNISIQPETKSIMRIRHPDHNLKIGYMISVENSTDINCVPAEIINRKHTINKIIDGDTYEAAIDLHIPTTFNLDSSLITIRYPDIFQLMFNKPDTFGSLLGFANIGTDHAVTNFGHKISNIDPYIGHSNYLIKNNVRDIPNYFYMCCPELSNFTNTAPVADVFTIIKKSKKSKKKLQVDTFVPVVKIFKSPLPQLSELNISFYYPDGKLVDFANSNHSFTLEITEIHAQPVETDIYTPLNAEVITRKI